MDTSDLYVDAPSIRALGSLFNLTEIFLWDNGTRKTRLSESTKLNLADSNIENIPSTTSDCSIIVEDVELTEQLNALGLPSSFLTNKKKKNGKNIFRNNASFKQSLSSNQDFHDEALEFSKVSDGEITSFIFDDDANSSSNCMFIMGQSECSDSHVAVDGSEVQFLSDDRQNSICSIKVTASAVKGHISNGISDHVAANIETHDSSLETRLSPQRFRDLRCNKQETLEKTMEDECSVPLSMPLCNIEFDNVCNSSNTTEVLVPKSSVHLEGSDLNENGGFNCGDYSGDWMVCWDNFYMRNYFFNIKTHDSTWYPPPGFEQFATVWESDYEANESLTDLNASPCAISSDMCYQSNKARSSEKSMDDDEVIHQSSDEFGIRISSCNSVSDSNLNTSTTSHKHLELSDVKEHAGSCDNKMKSPGLNEVCNDDSQLTCTDRPDKYSTYNLLDEHHSSTLHKEDCVYIDDDDEAFGSIDSSRPTGNGLTPKDGLDTENDPAIRRRKKKVRRTRGGKKLSIGDEEVQLQEMVEEYSALIVKYWRQRYLLFFKFDDGIKMDEEGWFSVTPESIARHHAYRCGRGLIIDCFTGVGGNAIQFAQKSVQVTAIDIDPLKIQYARHNAAVYGVEGQIDFVVGDFFALAPRLKADTIFLSPPWGGPDYAKVEEYDIKTMLKPRDGYSLFNIAMKIAPKIVMFLPRNVNLDQLAELSLSSHPPWALEVEKNYLNGKLKAITAYFTDNLAAEDSHQPTKFTE